MPFLKRISRHDHSGQLLPHHHTTYFGLGLLLSLAGVALLLITGIYRAQATTITQSGDISISGTVFGAPPTVPATILSPSSGDTILSSPITVSGSCGASLLVKIFRNDILAGSTVCSGTGTFSIEISLVVGKNTLRARNYDFQDQVGPDSPDVVVTHLVPTQSQPASTGHNISQSTGESNSLILTSNFAYKTVEPNSELEWPFEIKGGQTPYAVLIDWGDGEVSLISVKTAGTFTTKHIYRKAGTYRITVKVTDTLGNKAVIEVVAQSRGVSALPQIIQGPHYYDQVLPLLLAWPAYVFISCLVLSFWLGEKYYQHHLFTYLQTKKLRLVETRPTS